MTAGRFGEQASYCPRDVGQLHPTGIVGAFFVIGAFEHAPGKLPIERQWVGNLSVPEVSKGLQSPYAFGPWCWVVSEVIKFPNAIPCKGRQGLWNVPDEIERELRAASLLGTRLA